MILFRLLLAIPGLPVIQLSNMFTILVAVLLLLFLLLSLIFYTGDFAMCGVVNLNITKGDAFAWKVL